MKKIPYKIILVILGSAVLTGCLPNPFFGSCADWNCNNLNSRWSRAIDECNAENFTIVAQELGNIFGYTSSVEVQDSEIGKDISAQCIYKGGRYNIKKDEKYRHLFEK